MHRVDNFRDIVLDHIKLDGDRFQLRDNDQRIGPIRLNVITRIDQPQTSATIDRRGDVTLSEIYLRNF